MVIMRPQSATSCQESEMANKCQRELQATGCSGHPVKRLRLLCLSRGACGILVLERMFRQLDGNGSRQLGYYEFLGGLREIGLEISDHEAKTMFNKFDTDYSGGINVEDFLISVRPPMSKYRKRIVDQVFKKMDRTGHGVLTVADIKHVYNVSSNTRYISGEDTKESILKEFLDHFEQEGITDGNVTKEEFFNYYSAVSASIDNDCYFDLMMRQDYKL